MKKSKKTLIIKNMLELTKISKKQLKMELPLLLKEMKKLLLKPLKTLFKMLRIEKMIEKKKKLKKLKFKNN